MKENCYSIPVARIYFRGGEVIEPGWYVQHYVRAELQTTRLEIKNGAEPDDAVTEAAGFVGCIPAQIQIEGAPWPALQLRM